MTWTQTTLVGSTSIVVVSSDVMMVYIIVISVMMMINSMIVISAVMINSVVIVSVIRSSRICMCMCMLYVCHH